MSYILLALAAWLPFFLLCVLVYTMTLSPMGYLMTRALAVVLLALAAWLPFFLLCVWLTP